jgi:hypothetical protein
MKFLKIFFFFVSSNLFADMDKICVVNIETTAAIKQDWTNVFKDRCERNNILFLKAVPYDDHPLYIARLCRFDRNIERSKDSLSCVVYGKMRVF